MFSDPWWLLLLAVVAALVVGYVLVLRRRRRDTVVFTNLELLDRVAPRRPGRLRHLPAVALITSLAVLTIALAGPQAQARVPRNRATVVLIVDVSLSMMATDVTPSRLVAAQVAAKDFADQLTPGVSLGLVAFAGTAAVLVSPTVDREPVKRAIDGLRLSESTATGEAIFAALQSVDTFARSLQGTSENSAPPARIVLLSDGKQTVPNSGAGTPEEEPRGSFTAARAAAGAGVPVSTISFGTRYGTILIEGRREQVAVDDEAMRRIAVLGEGQFYSAVNERELRNVYSELGEQIGYETRSINVGHGWMVAGVLLLTVGVGAGLLLGRRFP